MVIAQVTKWLKQAALFRTDLCMRFTYGVIFLFHVALSHGEWNCNEYAPTCLHPLLIIHCRVLMK